MKKLFFILSMLFIGIATPLNAQPPDPGGGGGGPTCVPPCVPIDGGLSWLLLAGVAYGGKKVFDMNKKNEEEV